MLASKKRKLKKKQERLQIKQKLKPKQKIEDEVARRKRREEGTGGASDRLAMYKKYLGIYQGIYRIYVYV